jgi:hypothetical protein
MVMNGGLAFCEKYRHWREKEWRMVIYSNESTFESCKPEGSKGQVV